jgi:hypothetical protein
MPVARSITALSLCAVAFSSHAQITDLTTWDLYQDAASATPAQSAAMTGSATPNLAELNFVNDVDQNAGFDIGFSSIDGNTVADATSGFYFDASQDFTIAMHFSLQLTNPNGLVAIGLGIGEDRAGVNSAGIGFGVGSGLLNSALYGAAATNNDAPIAEPLSLSEVPDNDFFGSLTVSYDAATGDVTVGAAQFLGAPTPLAPTETFTFSGATDLADWSGDDLLVSFFLRSDAELIYGPWTGQTAEADFFDFTVVEGAAIPVPEPSSLALLGLGVAALLRRRRA